LRAILLARVSTKHEEQDTSPDRQLARLGQLAEAHGWQVVDRIVERESGAQVIDRPPVVRALQRIVDHEADVLVVDHLFRLGRNVRELLEVVDTIDEAGGHFFDATHKIDTTTPFGRVIFTVIAAIGEFEIADRREKILEGLQRARQRGKRLGPPPTVPRWDEAIDRAVALRLEERDGAAPPSWNQIRLQLEAEGFGKLGRGAISRAVGRRLDGDATKGGTDG
jgi:DNA invertase Pin-like site-specific DNA recombinase